MTVKSRRLEYEDVGIEWGALPWKKITAAAIWLVGVACTKQVTALVLPSYLDWLAAAVLQAMLTQLESPIWRRWAWDDKGAPYRRPLGLLNLGALMLDNVLNLGGVWVVLKTAHTWPPVVAIAQMFGRHDLAQLQGVWAFVLCFLFGAFLCGAPERLWYDED